MYSAPFLSFIAFSNSFVVNAFISPFNTQIMRIKTFYTQQYCYVFPKNVYPCGIRTRVSYYLILPSIIAWDPTLLPVFPGSGSGSGSSICQELAPEKLGCLFYAALSTEPKRLDWLPNHPLAIPHCQEGLRFKE
jgi:hypothetical protein